MISVASRDLAAKNTVFVTEIICFWFDQTKRHSVIISAGDEGARAEAPGVASTSSSNAKPCESCHNFKVRFQLVATGAEQCATLAVTG
jgi:hypothetical protein